MAAQPSESVQPTREQLFYALYEAAELEHKLMCTYLYAAFSLNAKARGSAPPKPTRSALAAHDHRRRDRRDGPSRGGLEHHVRARRRADFGRDNFPLDLGRLPAGIVVKLAPFNPETMQHFIFLERPHDSDEPEGEGFAPERIYSRGSMTPRADADADRLRHGRHVLRDARRNLRCFAEKSARMPRSAAIRGCSFPDRSRLKAPNP